MKQTLIDIEEYARQYDVPIIQDEGLEFLLQCIKDNNYKNILEIGSAIGYSAIQMANISKDIHVTTIERDEERYKQAISNIESMNLESQIDITLGDALEWDVKGSYDLIFIDAAKAQYIKFFVRYAPLLNVNGSILSDNLKFHGFVDTKERIKNRNTRQLVGKIKKYIHYLEDNEEYITTFYDIGDGIAITKHK